MGAESAFLREYRSVYESARHQGMSEGAADVVAYHAARRNSGFDPGPDFGRVHQPPPPSDLENKIGIAIGLIAVVAIIATIAVFVITGLTMPRP